VSVSTPRGDSTLTLSNVAVSTSGPSIQFVEIAGVRYSHVLDPRSGRPLTTPFEVTVLHADPATADALATAITVLGPEAGARLAATHGARLIRRRD
jgi:thiamine biosynthesis lipoprotein